MILPEPTLLLRPGFSRSRAGVVKPTESGGTIRVGGTTGNAWQTAEATTNYHTNPRGVSAYSGVTALTGISLDIPGGVHITTASRRTATGTTSDWFSTHAGIAAPGTSCAMSAWVRAGNDLAIGIPVQIAGYQASVPAGYGHGYSNSVFLSSEWQYVSFVDTTWTDNATRRLIVKPTTGNWPVGAFVDVTAQMIESKAYNTPYTDGSIGAGHAWTGPAHASTSTRAAGTVTVPNMDQYLGNKRGTMVLRRRSPDMSSTTGILSLGSGQSASTDFFQIRKNGTLDYFQWNTAGVWRGNMQYDFAKRTFVTHGYTWSEETGMMLYLPNGGVLSLESHNFTGTLAGTKALTLMGAGDSAWESVVFYEDVLTAAEVQDVMSIPSWSWPSLGYSGDPATPAYASSIYVLNSRIHRSTRDNEIGEEFTTSMSQATIDADMDRMGPKSKIDMTLIEPNAVQDGDWVAPFVRITPEIGDPVESQLGLYEMKRPTITWDGFGNGYGTVSGDDPVVLLDRNVTTEVETSGSAINVVQEIRYAIECATLTYRGPNKVPNARKPSVANGWSSTSGGAWVGSISYPVSTSYPTGQALRISTTSTSPFNALANATAPTVTIPVGATRLLFTAIVYVEAGYEVAIYAGWVGGANASVVPYHYPIREFGWYRLWGYIDVPDGITQVIPRVYARWKATESVNRSAYVGAIEVRAVQGTPARHQIPWKTTGVKSGEAISHPPNTKWLSRINDLATAIAYHGIHADKTGVFVTRPKRDPRKDTATHIYEPGLDSEIVGDIVTEQSTGYPYNIVVAMKEDYTTKDVIVAVARNTDPDDPWSIPNRGPIASTESLNVQDAADATALKDLAETELARASMQESIDLTVLPDPRLSLYDVIGLRNAGEATGRWAIESLTWGLDAENAIMHVGARRTLRGEP